MQQFYESVHPGFQAQYRRSVVLLALLGALMVISAVIGSLIRQQWLVVVIPMLVGSVGVFLFGMKFQPVFKYKRFLSLIQEGRKREDSGEVIFVGASHVLREGVWFREMHYQDEGGAERVAYVDANLPQPSVEVGQHIKIQHTGNTILALQVEGAPAR